ncbi:MAG: hypothetical protein CME25_07310 [Gemmatimonadetes bacterium]|nr:hypothetical protein [Gemmatimonadota bacterium]|tara:strand:- start:7973 stop:8263 length:291 start_codon:yes stop_codon:yes gene_type:complete
MDLASMMSPALTANWIGNEYRLETVDGNGRAIWARRLFKMSLPVSLLPNQTLRVKIIRTGIEPLKLSPSPQALDRENEEHFIPAQRSVTDSSSHGH